MSTSAQQRASRPPRRKKEEQSQPSKNKYLDVRAEAGVNERGRTVPNSQTSGSTSVTSNEANVKARGRLAPCGAEEKQRQITTQDDATNEDTEDTRKTNWRQYREQNQGFRLWRR